MTKGVYSYSDRRLPKSEVADLLNFIVVYQEVPYEEVLGEYKVCRRGNR
jgi:hypothetical protein